MIARLGTIQTQAWAAIAACGMLSVAVSAAEAEPEEPVSLSVLRESTDLPPETTLRASNRYGDLRARGVDSGSLELIAAVQRFEPEQPEAQIQVGEEAGSLHVEILYPSADPAQPGGPLRGRVDLTLLVPRGRELHLETEFGLVETKGVERDLFVQSATGRLELITSRPLVARTEAGDMRLLLRHSLRDRPHRIRSGSGDIELNVPASESLHLRARTDGEIANGLSNEAGSVVEEAGELLVGTPPFSIEIESRSGNIALHSR